MALKKRFNVPQKYSDLLNDRDILLLSDFKRIWMLGEDPTDMIPLAIAQAINFLSVHKTDTKVNRQRFIELLHPDLDFFVKDQCQKLQDQDSKKDCMWLWMQNKDCVWSTRTGEIVLGDNTLTLGYSFSLPIQYMQLIMLRQQCMIYDRLPFTDKVAEWDSWNDKTFGNYMSLGNYINQVYMTSTLLNIPSMDFYLFHPMVLKTLTTQSIDVDLFNTGKEAKEFQAYILSRRQKMLDTAKSNSLTSKTFKDYLTLLRYLNTSGIYLTPAEVDLLEQTTDNKLIMETA